MSGPIIFISTFEIREGRLEQLKGDLRKAIAFVEESGPQLMVESFVDEEAMRFHSIQVYADSESILSHWRMSDPYIRAVNQSVTMKRLDIFGQPSDGVMKGLQGIVSDDLVLTVTPHFAGFNRFEPATDRS